MPESRTAAPVESTPPSTTTVTGPRPVDPTVVQDGTPGTEAAAVPTAVPAFGQRQDRGMGQDDVDA